VCSIGVIQNAAKLADELLEKGCANFETMSSGAINSAGLIGALIAQKDSFVDGIRYAQDKIEGTMSLAIMTDKSMIVARDKDGRLPIIIGQRSDGYCFSFTLGIKKPCSGRNMVLLNHLHIRSLDTPPVTS
jgi:amidophosphoribosyltransferase